MYRVHVVCEGPTDMVMVEAALETHLEDFVSQQIQPEQSLFGGDQGPLGGGWKGVRSWCRQIRDQGGLRASGALANTDLLVVHLDADVADEDEVACARPCPPPSPTADALQEVVLSWLGEDEIRPELVFCIPSKSMEAWVLPGFWPASIRRIVRSSPAILRRTTAGHAWSVVLSRLRCWSASRRSSYGASRASSRNLGPPTRRRPKISYGSGRRS